MTGSTGVTANEKRNRRELGARRFRNSVNPRGSSLRRRYRIQLHSPLYLGERRADRQRRTASAGYNDRWRASRRVQRRSNRRGSLKSWETTCSEVLNSPSNVSVILDNGILLRSRFIEQEDTEDQGFETSIFRSKLSIIALSSDRNIYLFARMREASTGFSRGLESNRYYGIVRLSEQLLLPFRSPGLVAKITPLIDFL